MHVWARESQSQIHLKREDITEKVYVKKSLMRGGGVNGVLSRQGRRDRVFLTQEAPRRGHRAKSGKPAAESRAGLGKSAVQRGLMGVGHVEEKAVLSMGSRQIGFEVPLIITNLSVLWFARLKNGFVRVVLRVK